MLKKILSWPMAVILSLAISISVSAQVKTRIYEQGIPASESKMSVSKAKQLLLPEPAVFSRLLKNKDDFSGDAREYKEKFAVPVPVNINVLKEAVRWEENKTVYYALSLVAPKALNLTLQFDKFHLSPGATLSIFNDHEITENITAKENNENNIWATRIYQGARLNLLLQVPVSEEGKTAININTAGLGFKEMGSVYWGVSGASAPCNINVACPEGNGWNNERDAVALIVSNASEHCTGTLIMNTCGNNRPFLLTANHCLNGSVQNWVFQFFTFSVNCNPNGFFREDMQFNGCQLRANNAATDFALVELNQTPAANSGINYAGWNRNAAPAASTTGLHHPRGDIMKVSNDFQAPIAVNWPGAGGHWRAAFDQGIVQFGSSGSALFDQNHRVVGQLHGNQNNQCTPADNNCWCVTQMPAIGEYGRFDLSWTGGGTNATRLSNWLDPAGNNATTTNTTNINALTAANPGMFISGSGYVCSGAPEIYTLNGAPAGATITWTSSNNSIATVSGSGNLGTVTYMGTGYVTITATVTGCALNVQVPVNIVSGVPAPADIIGMDISVHFSAGQYVTLYIPEYASSYNWYIAGGTVIGSTTDQSVTAKLDNCFPNQTAYNYFDATVTYQNACGTSMYRYEHALAECNGLENPEWRVQVLPNPAHGYLYIKKQQPAVQERTASNMPVTYQLQDFYTKKIVKQWTFNNNNEYRQLNIKEIKKGIYVLTITKGKQKQSIQVMIE